MSLAQMCIYRSRNKQMYTEKRASVCIYIYIYIYIQRDKEKFFQESRSEECRAENKAAFSWTNFTDVS
jgi:hypothetical protein